MTVGRSIVLFVVAALAEIGGARTGPEVGLRRAAAAGIGQQCQMTVSGDE